MIELIESVVSNVTVFRVGVTYCIPLTVVLVVLFFVKSSRDERGRAIIGKASIISTITFIVLINAFAEISQYITINYLTTACCVQWIYDIVLSVEVFAILIFKKIG